MASPNAMDLMLFHSKERELFGRLVQQLGQEVERMKMVMALWLWLESIGHHDFIRHVSAYDGEVILRFIEEAQVCLDCIAAQNENESDQFGEIPFTSSLVVEPMDVRFFAYNRDVAKVGVSRIFHNVCQIIFDDKLMELISKDRNHPANKQIMSSGLIIRPIGEGTSSQVQQTPPPVPIVQQSTLNPLAKPWSPQMNLAAEDRDDRSMFLTFGKGHLQLLAREEIKDFFNSRFGPCVDKVFMERLKPGSRKAVPTYGRVIFKNAAIIPVVLNGQQTAKFMVNGKDLWARIYIPRGQNY